MKWALNIIATTIVPVHVFCQNNCYFSSRVHNWVRLINNTLLLNSILIWPWVLDLILFCLLVCLYVAFLWFKDIYNFDVDFESNDCRRVKEWMIEFSPLVFSAGDSQNKNSNWKTFLKYISKSQKKRKLQANRQCRL